MACGRGPPCSCQTRQVATPAASMAGCVRSVAPEVRLGALLTELPEVVAEHLGRLGEGLLHDRRRCGELGEHADRLRALPGKDNGECHGRLGHAGGAPAAGL